MHSARMYLRSFLTEGFSWFVSCCQCLVTCCTYTCVSKCSVMCWEFAWDAFRALYVAYFPKICAHICSCWRSKDRVSVYVSHHTHANECENVNTLIFELHAQIHTCTHIHIVGFQKIPANLHRMHKCTCTYLHTYVLVQVAFKCRMAANLNRMKKMLPDEFKFFPDTVSEE